MKVPLGSCGSLTKPKTKGGKKLGERDSRNLSIIPQILLVPDQAEGGFQSAGFSQALAWVYDN